LTCLREYRRDESVDAWMCDCFQRYWREENKNRKRIKDNIRKKRKQWPLCIENRNEQFAFVGLTKSNTGVLSAHGTAGANDL
jgi:hypothetical protein